VEIPKTDAANTKAPLPSVGYHLTLIIVGLRLFLAGLLILFISEEVATLYLAIHFPAAIREGTGDAALRVGTDLGRVFLGYIAGRVIVAIGALLCALSWRPGSSLPKNWFGTILLLLGLGNLVVPFFLQTNDPQTAAVQGLLAIALFSVACLAHDLLFLEWLAVVARNCGDPSIDPRVGRLCYQWLGGAILVGTLVVLAYYVFTRVPRDMDGELLQIHYLVGYLVCLASGALTSFVWYHYASIMLSTGQSISSLFSSGAIVSKWPPGHPPELEKRNP
jgi:hypothetical protein